MKEEEKKKTEGGDGVMRGGDATTTTTTKKKKEEGDDDEGMVRYGKMEIRDVAVHPLVLLSVVDHYNRVAKDTKKRSVGIILGEVRKGRVEATNSFAVPFEEDEKNADIWFLDHSYLENMFRMFKKVNGA